LDEPQAAVDIAPADEQRADGHVTAPDGPPVAEHYAAPDEHQTPEITEEPIARIAPDDDLEDGWRAAMPSARFVSTAIACAGAGLIIAGLAMRFQTL
jgi:hypothetical protein